MKKSEKLYYSLGTVRDEWLDDAIGADITKNKVRSGGKTIALRRILVAAAVCVLSVSLAITCAANADLIKSLFQREQELIDPYAAMIDETSEAEGVSVKMDKIAKDGDRYIIYLHLSRPEGFEPGYLTYGSIILEQQTEDGWVQKERFAGARRAENALLAGVFLTEIPEKTSEVEVLVNVDSSYSQCFNGVSKGDFRLTLEELSTVQIVEENGGSAKYAAEYADTLTVDFEFDESKIEPLPEKVSYPNIEFEVAGSKFKLTEMRYTPMHLELHFEDEIGQTYEVGGKELFATNKLNYRSFTVDEPLEVMPFSWDSNHALTDEEQKWLEEQRRKTEEQDKWRDENGSELDKFWYYLEVETTLEDDQWTCAQDYQIEDGKYNMNKPIMTWNFSKPMYEEDILSVSFVKYIYEEYPANADTKYTVDRVVVWENEAAVPPVNSEE